MDRVGHFCPVTGHQRPLLVYCSSLRDAASCFICFEHGILYA